MANINITTANVADGRVTTASVGAPVNSSFAGSIAGNASTIAIPNGTLAGGNVTIDVAVDSVNGALSWQQFAIRPDGTSTNGTLIDCDVWKSSLRVTNASGVEVYPNGVGELSCGTYNVYQTWQAIGGGAITLGAETIIPLRFEYGGSTATAAFVSQANGTDNTYTLTIGNYDDTVVNTGKFVGGVTGDAADTCEQVVNMGDCTVGGGTFPPITGTTYLSDTIQGNLLPRTLNTADTAITEVLYRHISDSVRHQYSSRQAWNIDRTRIDLSNGVYNYPAMSGYIDLNAQMSGEHNWSYTNPDVMFGTSGNQLVSYNVVSGVRTVIATVTQWSDSQLGRFQGHQDVNDRYFIVNDGQSQLTVIDATNGSYPTPIAVPGGGSFDWAGMSHFGNYITGQYGGTGFILNRDLTNLRTMNLPGAVRHGDNGLDENGDEVFAMVGTDYMDWIKLSDNTRTVKDLGINGVTGHLGCARGRPGYAYLTQHSTQTAYATENRAVVAAAIRLDYAAGSRIEQFGHTRSTTYDESQAEYNYQAKGSPSFLGDAICFSSTDYGRGNGEWALELK